jgi:hypothetical protein
MTQKVLIFRETTLQTHRTSRCIRNIFYRIFLTLYNMLKFNFKNQVHVLPGAETACPLKRDNCCLNWNYKLVHTV